MVLARAAARYSRSLILRHRGGAISSLRLATRIHDLYEDVLDPSTLLPKNKDDVENILAFDKGTEIWRLFLTPTTITSRFNTVALPRPSAFKDCENKYYMQLMIYPNQYFGWYSVYNKKEEGDKYTSNYTSKFGIEPLVTENIKTHRAQKMYDYEFFRGCITPSIASSLRVCATDYKREEERLGKGKQGDTFIGYCLLTQKKVLMKKFKHPLIQPDGEAREVFYSKNVIHSSIREMESAFVDDQGVSWIILDLNEMSMHDFLDDEDRIFNYHERLAIFIQVGQAVKHLKGEGVVYIDLEPGNVLLTEGLDTVLADLGSCVTMVDGECEASYFQSWSPQYAAPELLLNKKHTDKVVSYALGLLYFTAMSSGFYTKAQRRKRIEQFTLLISSDEWKDDDKTAWSKSLLSKGFEGNSDLLISCVQKNPIHRPTIEEILAKAGRKGC